MSKIEVSVFVLVVALMIFTINSVYITGYTASVIELSKSMCKGSMYLEKVEWFYIDIIEVRSGVYAFAGPIGVSLVLLPAACLLRETGSILLAGGVVMCVCILVSMLFLRLAVKEVFTQRYSYPVTSIVITVLASMPWVYSSHLFPQAILAMCYSALLYFSAKLILDKGISMKIVLPHAAFSAAAFLADPSSAILVVAIAMLILVEKRRFLREHKARLIILLSSWLAVAFLISLPQFYYNFAVTGDPLLFPELAYSQIRKLGVGFNFYRAPIGVGVQLVDFRKSLLSLYPASFISFISIFKVLRYVRKRSLGLLYVFMVLIPLVVYSSWHDFHGGLSFGPRFLTPVTQILALPLLLLLSAGGRISKFILILSLYSVFENSVVLVSTPYPCAFQHLGTFENQFYACSLRLFLEGTKSALVADLMSRVTPLNPLEANVVSAGAIFTIATLIILLSYAKKI